MTGRRATWIDTSKVDHIRLTFIRQFFCVAHRSLSLNSHLHHIISSRATQSDMTSSDLLNLRKQLGFYGAYHSEKRNVAVHVVFVPTIFWTYMFFVSRIFPSPAVFESHVINYTGMAVPFRLDLSGGSILSMLYAAYYFALDAQTAMLYLPLLVLMGATSAGLAAFKPEVLYPMLILHVASWAAQIISHKIFEGKAPALFDNLIGALVLAPFFTFFEVLFLAFDYRPELKKDIENESGKYIVAHNKALREKQGKKL